LYNEKVDDNYKKIIHKFMEQQTSQVSQSPTITPSVKRHLSLRSALLYLTYIVTLYTSIWAVTSILFSTITKAFPGTQNYYGDFGSPISWPSALIIVIFPIFLFVTRFVNGLEDREVATRKVRSIRNIIYLNIFLSALTLASSLITVLYYFFSGQDFTTAFVLKVITVIVIAGLVFGYYFQELRNTLTGQGRKIWAIVGGLFVLSSLILGFVVFGSPRTQRLYRVDNQKIASLQRIQDGVLRYWQSKDVLPLSISAMNVSFFNSYEQLPLKDDENKVFTYKVTGTYSFDLCAEFNLDAPLGWGNASYPSRVGDSFSNWTYKKGQSCFSRTIDPEVYKVNKTNVNYDKSILAPLP
jgi:hypothetical protein